jgi:hypothetical protein
LPEITKKKNTATIIFSMCPTHAKYAALRKVCTSILGDKFNMIASDNVQKKYVMR